MPYVERTGIFYEVKGDANGVPLLMIHGYTAQMIGWRPAFLDCLIDMGLNPVIFDNRDVGLSRKYGGPDDIDAGYSIADMATDALSVLDELGISQAHIAGQSMGGMIAQSLMVHHPERLKSATLIYTSPATRFRLSRHQNEIVLPVPRLPRDLAIEAYVEREKMSRSEIYSFDEDWARSLGGAMYDRCYCPEGNYRQRVAVQTEFDFSEGLKDCTLSTAIVHGRSDLLIEVQAAFHLGKLLTNSELHIFPGMGHEIVPPLFGDFAKIIRRTVGRGE